jgi:hypothetical protein
LKTRIIRAAAVAGAAVLIGILGATPAQAAPPPYVIQYHVINKVTLSTNYVNYSNQLAQCASVGGTCTISISTNATRTIGLSLGMSRDGVAAGLSISSATTVGTTVACTSPTLSSGQVFRAYPVGTRYSYKVQKNTITGPTQKIEVSGTLYAFNPRANSVWCGVR